MKKLSNKKIDQMIEEAYRKSCSGIPINILDISKVFKVGQIAIEQGKTGLDLEQAIRAFVETIRADKGSL